LLFVGLGCNFLEEEEEAAMDTPRTLEAVLECQIQQLAPTRNINPLFDFLQVDDFG
jgi:hypothetical protein